ncbi:hypothetical protein BURPS1710b_0110 [Burkholderia pseudomallei 1710b]|uniref:Uncharacterized protein n=1 Tax=Burkholderia pseudomallei (strain 1710b) TaxID=320372 RepID=Q3JY26_BURP1|nr:hypothetical protein BURPS1710b_0110 [Burkholderia pseudomallei 1710b]
MSNLPTAMPTGLPANGFCALADGGTGSVRDASVAQPDNATMADAARHARTVFEVFKRWSLLGDR